MLVAPLLDGFLLHRRAYRETSYIAEFFTLQEGKVSAVVRGVRSAKSDKKSLLQPFQPLLLSIKGRQELKNLHQLEASQRALPLVGEQLYCGMYLNELLTRALAAHLPMEVLFHQYQHSLQALADARPVPPILREFELALLDALGLGLDFGHEWQTGKPVVANGYYRLVAQQGVEPLARPITHANCFVGQALLDMVARQWNAGSLACAKWANRLALAEVIGHKPLKSREFFIKR